MFESRVILDGSQTELVGHKVRVVFESRVILDGSQTTIQSARAMRGLRVVLF